MYVCWEKGLNTMFVAGGAQHSLVLTTEGLFSFGRNDSGQLGCTEKMSKDDWGAFEKYPMEVSVWAGGQTSSPVPLVDRVSFQVASSFIFVCCGPRRRPSFPCNVIHSFSSMIGSLKTF